MRTAHLLRSIFVAFALAGSVAGCAAIQGRETAGEYLDDTTVTTKVNASIMNELGVGQVGVETMQGVVQLTGFVDTQQKKDRAGQIARGVSGVKEVKNNIVVR